MRAQLLTLLRRLKLLAQHWFIVVAGLPLQQRRIIWHEHLAMVLVANLAVDKATDISFAPDCFEIVSHLFLTCLLLVLLRLAHALVEALVEAEEIFQAADVRIRAELLSFLWLLVAIESYMTVRSLEHRSIFNNKLCFVAHRVKIVFIFELDGVDAWSLRRPSMLFDCRFGLAILH